MPSCPKCHQTVDSQALQCPYCRTSLKAYGHPGIPLHRAEAGEYLCKTCIYDADDTCNYPQRPYATECMLYQDQEQPMQITSPKPSTASTAKFWLRQNRLWVAIALVLAISLMVAAS